MIFEIIDKLEGLGTYMVKKNHEYIVAIEDMGSEGEGVGKIDGYTVFVKYALPGEEAYW